MANLGNVSALNAVGNVYSYCKQSEVKPSEMIDSTIDGGAELLAKSLKAIAQGWMIKNTPEKSLSSETLEQKTTLEQAGLNVIVRPDGKFIVEAQQNKNVLIASSDIKNVAVLKGNFEIYNNEPQSDVEFPNLETIEGDFTISGFHDECRTIGSQNWGYACDVKFPNLKKVAGDVNVQNSACYLDLNALETVCGSLNVGASCQSDNEIYLKNIQLINGDFNIQAGSVSSSSQIFAAVEGTMNAIPPKSNYTNGFGTCLKIGENPNAKYYEFTTEVGVIKKYAI